MLTLNEVIYDLNDFFNSEYGIKIVLYVRNNITIAVYKDGNNYKLKINGSQRKVNGDIDVMTKVVKYLKSKNIA